MAQKFLVYQSLWAMERRRPDGHKWALDENLAMIRDAGVDCCGVRFIDPSPLRLQESIHFWRKFRGSGHNQNRLSP